MASATGFSLGTFAGFAPSAEEIHAMGGPPPLTPGGAGPQGTPSLAAPGAPLPPTVVASTSRGGAGDPGPALTVGSLFANDISKRGLPEFLAVLEADAETPAEVFLSATEEDLAFALSAVTVDGVALSAMARASVILAIRGVFERSGYEAPQLGTVARRPVAAPTSLPSAVCEAPTAHAPGGAEGDGELVNLSQYVDQASRQQARRLTYEEVRSCRAAYVATCGAPPPEEHLPTSEQLAALRHLLVTNRAPYVDFAVWSPLGPRLAKFRRTEAAVLIGGAFVTKPLDAPQTFEAWEESWQLFAVAMITLGAATPASLGAYFAGIRKLLRLFPGRWGAIAAQDLIVRSERWNRMREDFVVQGAAESSAPWDRIIATSAFGAAGPSESWWNLHLVLPLTVHAPLDHAGLPGAPSSSTSPGQMARRGRAPQAARPRPWDQPPAKSQKTGPARDVSKENCNLFNAQAAPCNGSGPCTYGRRHVCSVCGESHAAAAHHPEFKEQRRQDTKARGKGRAKDSRK